MLHTIEDIRSLFEDAGTRLYGGEAVSQREHGLQAAWFAEKSGEADSLIVACLLHDLGHMVLEQGDDDLARGIDDQHQVRVIPLISHLFPASVTTPIALHVEAKRYLCFAEPSYAGSLSQASQDSLALQGGPMDAQQAKQFIEIPYAQAALALRRYDDAAKIRDLVTPDFQHFLPRLLAVSKQYPQA